MHMPEVTDAHRKLDVFIGRWTGEEVMHPSPFDPKGGPAKGIADNRRALDGMAVIQDYEQTRGGKIGFRGHAVLRFDAQDGRHHMHWFDSMGCQPGDFVGGEANGTWTFTSDSPQGQCRCSFEFTKPDAYTFRMDVSQDGKQWVPMMEGKYRKA